MAKDSKIQWTDHTVNLWWGCSKVHTGCKNCYAESLSNRFGNDIWGEKKGRKRIKSAFNDLAKYQAQAQDEGKKYKIFVGSMMDIVEENKPLNNPIIDYATISDLRIRLFTEIELGYYPDLIFLFLTKRPERIEVSVPKILHYFPNVWFGTSISNAETVSYGRILQQAKVRNKFLSIEPHVGRIKHDDIGGLLHGIDWVIQGGESGPGKRPFDIAWAHEMREICRLYKTPYFFKQIDKVQDKDPKHEALFKREFPIF